MVDSEGGFGLSCCVGIIPISLIICTIFPEIVTGYGLSVSGLIIILVVAFVNRSSNPAYDALDKSLGYDYSEDDNGEVRLTPTRSN